MEIIDTQDGKALSHNGQTVALPAQAFDSTVHAYQTPAGLWVGIQEPGKPRPVYAGSGGVKIGEIELPADPVAALAHQKDQALETLKHTINDRLEVLTNQYPEREAHTWPTAVQEAKEYLADNAATVPHLSASATEAGITVEALANEILNNAANFSAASGQLVGLRIKVKEAIKAATTEQEVYQAMELLK